MLIAWSNGPVTENTADAPARPAARRARVVHVCFAQKRAWGMPGARCTRSLAWEKIEPHEHSHHRFTGVTPWAQAVVATPVRFLFTGDSNSSSASAGVFHPRVFLGLALRAAATADISSGS
jgi:hypothetical protein